MYKLVIISYTTLLVACAGSPPQPPTVDGSDRTSINNDKEVRKRIAELKYHPVPLPATVAPKHLPTSKTITINFSYNSAVIQPTESQEIEIQRFAMNIADISRIEVRARTDGKHTSPGDERIAFMRAQAALNYLVAHGIPATKISVNYLSAGDYVADNYNSFGRALNRRVDIEFF